MTSTVTTAAPPAGLEHKSAAGAGLVDVDEDEGLVTAIVSVTGIKDRVNDVILPGAYRGRPIGVWSHDDKVWASRTEEHKELPPGDPALPTQTSDGRPWPKDAGGLWVKTRYNLETQAGKEAFSNVKFFRDQTGWSIGYRVPPGGSTTKNGVRYIKELEVWEYSPVMVGAASEPMTLSTKSATSASDLVDVDLDAPEDDAADDALALRALAEAGEIDWSDAEAAGVPQDGDESESADPGQPAEDGRDGIPADVVPADAGELAASGEVKKKFAAAERDQAASAGAAMPDGSYPIENAGQLADAIQAFGRAKDKTKAKAHIIARARALGLTGKLPDGWKADLADLETKYDTSPVGKPGGRPNWVDKAGGLPPFLRAVVHALMRGGTAEGTAIQKAMGTMRRWAAGGGKVTDKTKAKAAEVVAWWAAHTGGNTGGGKSLLDGWQPDAEIGPRAAHLPPTPASGPVESKMYPLLDGSLEARAAAIRSAVTEALRGQETTGPDGQTRYEWDYVCVDATFDGRLIATRADWSTAGESRRETFQISYHIDPAGAVVLGEPSPAHLATVVVPGADPASPAVDAVAQASAAVKALLASGETKAGRVLSGANAGRLSAAVEHLLDVLRAAGIDIAQPPPQDTAGIKADQDVPASAFGPWIDPADYVRGLRLRAGL